MEAASHKGSIMTDFLCSKHLEEETQMDRNGLLSALGGMGGLETES
jgi:hypothetical protein